MSTVDIPLSGKHGTGRFVTVDQQDEAFVNEHRWVCLADLSVVRSSGKKMLYLHRQLLGEPELQVDHKDHNRLNCTRANLRIATPSQNAQNCRLRRTSKSGVKGVSWHKHGCWQARILVGGKRIGLGYYKDKQQAANAYKDAAAEHFGEWACTDPIPEGEYSR